MHRAGAGTENSVVVVEGFFDCMKVHQAGVRSVVGLMGSALYEPQRHVLMERFRHVILMLDGDPTGRKASTVIAETVTATLRSPSGSLTRRCPAGPVAGEGYRKGPAAVRQRRLAVR